MKKAGARKNGPGGREEQKREDKSGNVGKNILAISIEAFIVHPIQSWLTSFAVKIFDDFFESLDHEYIGTACHWADDDSITVI